MKKSKAYQIVINNPSITGEELQEYLKKLKGYQYAYFQKEKGDEGTVHFQIALGFTNQRHFQSVQKDFKKWKPHIEASHDGYKNTQYCTKEESRLEGPWTDGPLPAKRNTAGETAAKNKQLIEMGVVQAVDEGHIPVRDIVRVQACILLYKQLTQKLKPLDKLDNTWYYGPTGTGKSKTARQEHPDHYDKMFNSWWDGYDNQETVLLDDLDKEHHKWIGHTLKQWADHYPFTAPVKGAATRIRPKRIVVTSNYHPASIWEDPQILEPILRRFKIIDTTPPKVPFMFISKNPFRKNNL